VLGAKYRGERWVLKSGAHLWALPALLGEYPDARFIQTHRDPVKIVASLSSLFAYLGEIFSDEVTLADTARTWAELILDGLDRAVDAREDGSIAPDRVVDVQFEAFMADHWGTIRGIYDQWGVELTADVEGRMKAFLDDHGREKHGKHLYKFADTGLDEGEIRERAKRYTDYFDVPVAARRRGADCRGPQLSRGQCVTNPLSHLNERGEAHMVDVSGKAVSARTAIAQGFVAMQPATLALIREGTAAKGDVLATARIAGIMAAKRTHELIPLCHPLALSKVTVDFEESTTPVGLRIEALVKVTGQTGVEMEALTAVSVACLTIYDMLKAVDKAMSFRDIRLIEKTGGRSGTYRAADAQP
jgi:cyclic pyranopterin phosphate synthase